MLRALQFIATLSLVTQLVSPPRPLVIAAGTLLDGRGGAFRDTRIVVQGARIVDIDPTATPVDIDLSGLTVMPGWIDTHVHLSWHFDEHGSLASPGEPPETTARHVVENARATLMAGFTTVRSLGAPIDRAARSGVGSGPGDAPRVLTSLGQVMGEAGPPDALRLLVRGFKAEGADAIKVFATEGLGGATRQTMTDAQLAAACGEARALGLRSPVHAVYDAGARAAVSAGCSSIEHGNFLSNGTLTLMAERGTWFDPNLLVWHNYVARPAEFGLSAEAVETIRRGIGPAASALRRARARGVKIVFGTDAVAGAHGRNAEEFIYRVREAGEKPVAVLASATSVAAESLGLGHQVGTVAPGFDADLVATAGNPLNDVTAVRRVVFVMRAGVTVRKP